MERGRKTKSWRADLRAMEEDHLEASEAHTKFRDSQPPPNTPSDYGSIEVRSKSPPEWTRHWSEFIPHGPMPIPNAIPKERLPVMTPRGHLFKTAAYAPRDEKEIEAMKKRDEEERVLDERYRRLKQGAIRYAAYHPEIKNKDFVAYQYREEPPEESDHEEPYPPYHRHVMKQFAHQYGHTTTSLGYEEGIEYGRARVKEEKEEKQVSS
ncbi:hypothetical protein F4808DRAFT_468942 [Astrocystis sublimbata]|nr:hypothetical protein F4808DRAFT_468942 [Astrocystis sublimbata]